MTIIIGPRRDSICDKTITKLMNPSDQQLSINKSTQIKFAALQIAHKLTVVIRRDRDSIIFIAL